MCVNISIFKAYLHETLIITCARAIYTFRRFATWLLHMDTFHVQSLTITTTVTRTTHTQREKKMVLR